MTDPASQLASVDTKVDPLVGATLDGRYLLERVLGSGGMGVVYAARHVILGKRLAVKVLRQAVSQDHQVMARFRREAQSASAIGSPHICDVSDFGTMQDGSTYFVMEFLDGPPLTKLIESDERISYDLILQLAIQLCDALGAAHERGIVHRDLKPDNVHVVRQGNRTEFVKVLDFGIAKVGGAADKKLTQAGQVFGTPHYMSPEQCSGREVDHRTDIYALGVMMYEMATGQVPFDSDNLMGVLTKHVYEQPIPPRELPTSLDVPPGLESVILKCLEKQPEVRYGSMLDLRRDLQICAQGSTPHAVAQAVVGASSMSQSVVGWSGASAAFDPGSSQMSSSQMSSSQMSSSYLSTSSVNETRSSRSGRWLLVVAAAFLVLVFGGVAFAVAFLVGAPDTEPPDVAAETPSTDEPREADPPQELAVVETSTDATGDDAPPTAAEETGTPAEIAATGTEPPPVAPAPVHIICEPTGAEVLDAEGALVGTTPLDVPRPPAGESLTLVVRKEGFEERRVTVSALTSSELTVHLNRRRRSHGRRSSHIRQTPTPQPLAPTPRPLVRPRARRMNSEIVEPW